MAAVLFHCYLSIEGYSPSNLLSHYCDLDTFSDCFFVGVFGSFNLIQLSLVVRTH